MTTTARTILAQLGSNKFLAMTGAKQLVALENGLQFSLPRAAHKGINRVIVRLDPTDTYSVQFGKYSTRTLSLEPIAEHSGIYADQLQDLFTAETGLLTHL